MIIVVQTVGALMESLRRHLMEINGSLAEKILWTKDYRQALDQILADRDKEERTIVISSNVFHATERHPQDQFMTGGMFAGAVKNIDPRAWFFIFSAMPPRKTKEIDGYIPKGMSSREIFEFLQVDFSTVTTLEALYERLPWLNAGGAP